MENEASLYIKKLMNFYDVDTLSELSLMMSIGQPSISKWKSNNSITAIKKKCRELGIYNDIFGDQQTVTNNYGQNAQNVSGNQNFKSSKDDLENSNNIDKATYSLFQEAYDKAVENDDIKKLRLVLMDF